MMKPESVWGAVWYVHRPHYNCKEPFILLWYVQKQMSRVILYRGCGGKILEPFILGGKQMCKFGKFGYPYYCSQCHSVYFVESLGPAPSTKGVLFHVLLVVTAVEIASKQSLDIKTPPTKILCFPLVMRQYAVYWPEWNDVVHYPNLTPCSSVKHSQQEIRDEMAKDKPLQATLTWEVVWLPLLLLWGCE